MSEVARRPTISPVQSQTELIDPWSGDLVDCSDLELAAEFRGAIIETKNRLTQLGKEVDRIVLAELAKRGQGTLRIGKLQIEKEANVEYEWDEEILAELLDAGLPQERYAELVVEEVKRKVRQNVAKQIEAINPVYKEIIERARTTVEKPATIKIKGGD